MIFNKLAVASFLSLAATSVKASVTVYTIEGEVCVEDGTTITYGSTVGKDTATHVITVVSNTDGSDINYSIASSGLYQWQQDLLDEHNLERAKHVDTPALTWSSSLASIAQAEADAYDCSGTLTHADSPYGNNLAIGYSPVDAVDAWYNEIADYNFADPAFSTSTGHFTQVVWADTTEVGCGIKYCGAYYHDFITCYYNPPGNYIGEFAEEVHSLV
ncbi:hypothetical protein TPHA_0I01070 [Tetrapisispora phaffii CBS 4417]|uniref:SCP domain-containing protein n=1 Tax=Tetrapisispora phaffii (strain ATCC 24235 / CBS 4417 / NBRC 1672 / NRRL Y-8282 / UCD 70-5) TaxID=1071381 RepID=G8BXI5_TETPH|nr:hypothetical protein TPHA_0I01070 [Tetrapisispora phaffii CBS 4417]CCE64613.1 hypothetical protein TPHA_0I01070 [Tetrapisispora phaffii CBS 4417]